jgi:hypothetical protein
MAAFVLDASIAVSWCFPEDPAEDTLYSRHILALLATHDAIVPQIWAFEVANSIFVAFAKRRRISEPQIEEYLERLKGAPDQRGSARPMANRRSGSGITKMESDGL